MTLKEFLDNPAINTAYVQHEDFESLYVRKGKRYLPTKDGMCLYDHVIDLAKINAFSPGNGAFHRLLDWLDKHIPEYVIYIESVLTNRFARKLDQLGFTRVAGETSYPCFFRENQSAKPSQRMD